MADIKITFGEVKTKAGQIRTCNENLSDYLSQIKQKISALDVEWTSDTSDTIREKINGMQGKFEDYKNIIESYAKFLETTVELYEATESTLNSNASMFE